LCDVCTPVVCSGIVRIISFWHLHLCMRMQAVLGGVHRVEKAVDVLLMRYPEVKVVPIISTCSTEIIGDDIDGVVRKLNSGLLKEKYADREVHLIPIHTPSFKGSMIEGYDVAVKDFCKKHLLKKKSQTGKLI